MLILSGAVLTLGVLTGFLLSMKVLDDDPNYLLLKIELVVATLILPIQVGYYLKAKNSLSHYLDYLGCLTLSMCWWMVSGTFPMIMLETVPLTQQIVAGLFFCWWVTFNVKLAFATFEERWQEVGKQEFEWQTKSKRNAVDWEKITHTMNIQIEMLRPGLSEQATTVTSLVMFGLFMAGCLLIDFYPIAGMTLLTPPFLVCAVFFLQASAYRFAQARKVRQIERELGCALQSISLPRRKRSKRR